MEFTKQNNLKRFLHKWVGGRWVGRRWVGDSWVGGRWGDITATQLTLLITQYVQGGRHWLSLRIIVDQDFTMIRLHTTTNILLYSLVLT